MKFFVKFCFKIKIKFIINVNLTYIEHEYNLRDCFAFFNELINQNNEYVFQLVLKITRI